MYQNVFKSVLGRAQRASLSVASDVLLQMLGDVRCLESLRAYITRNFVVLAMLHLLVVLQGLEGRVDLPAVLLFAHVVGLDVHRFLLLNVHRRPSIFAVSLHRVIPQRLLRLEVLRTESAIERSDVFMSGLVLVPAVGPRQHAVAIPTGELVRRLLR